MTRTFVMRVPRAKRCGPIRILIYLPLIWIPLMFILFGCGYIGSQRPSEDYYRDIIYLEKKALEREVNTHNLQFGEFKVEKNDENLNIDRYIKKGNKNGEVVRIQTSAVQGGKYYGEESNEEQETNYNRKEYKQKLQKPAQDKIRDDDAAKERMLMNKLTIQKDDSQYQKHSPGKAVNFGKFMFTKMSPFFVCAVNVKLHVHNAFS